MITDIERKLGSDGIGRIKIEGKKLLRVGYADDLVSGRQGENEMAVEEIGKLCEKEEICDKWRN